MGTNSAQLHVQRPQLSVIDGVKVCVCPVVCAKVCEGSCGYTCDWYPLPAGAHVLTLPNLSPGSVYQLGVYSTSHQKTGPPYYTQHIKTGDCTYNGGEIAHNTYLYCSELFRERFGDVDE